MNPTRPDFLAQRNSDSGLFVEARVAFDQSDSDAAAQARIKQAYDALNRLDSPDFFLSIEVEGVPATPVPARQLKEAIATFWRNQDYDECVQLLDSRPRRAPEGDVQARWLDRELLSPPEATGGAGHPGLATDRNSGACFACILQRAPHFGEQSAARLAGTVTSAAHTSSP